MQDNFEFEYTNDKKNKKGKGLLIGILCLCLGLLIGVGATASYYYNKMETMLENSSSQQVNLEEKLNELEGDVDSLDSQVEQLGYTADADENVVIDVGSYSDNVQSVAENVMPSVVGVRTISVQEATNYFMGSTPYEVEGVGTGVIVSEDGVILTNQHVVSDNPKSITVTLMDGSEYEASVIYSDEAMDLAVIKIDAEGLPAAELGDSDDVSVGEVTIAIGNPLGLEYERSVTAGIVSALDRSIQLEQYSFATNLIQTDAAINSGNSGGPLLNSEGEVIGINTYKLSSGEGMGFAVPINSALPIVGQVLETGEFVQARLGASFIDSNIYDLLTDAQLEQLGMVDIVVDEGLMVLDIDEQAKVFDSEMEIYDILVSADGVEVDTMLELRTIIYSHLPGDTIELEVERDGQIIAFQVTLSETAN